MADTSEATLKRATTMEVTAEEGHKILAEDGTTVEETADHLRSGQTFKKSEEEDEPDTDITPVKKTLTITQTVKEAEAILGDEELGRTRGQDQAPGEDENEGEKEKTPALTKTMTMADTLKESAPIVEALGDRAEGGTRAEAKKIEDAVKESEDELNNQHSNGDSDTAALKRKGTMLTTAEEGEEFLKRQKLAESNGDDAATKEVEA